MDYTRDDLLQALNSLAQDETRAQRRLDTLLTAANTAQIAGVEVRLSEDVVLNPLLCWVLKDPQCLTRFLELVNAKRKEVGYLQLTVERGSEAPKPRREYLAEHMRGKRDRERRLVEAWNLMLPANRQLRGQARQDFQRMHANRWYAAKLARKDALDRALGRVPSREEIQRMEADFWNEVEEEIAALEQFARDEMRRGAAERSPHGFKFWINAKKDA